MTTTINVTNLEEKIDPLNSDVLLIEDDNNTYKVTKENLMKDVNTRIDNEVQNINGKIDAVNQSIDEKISSISKDGESLILNINEKIDSIIDNGTKVNCSITITAMDGSSDIYNGEQKIIVKKLDNNKINEYPIRSELNVIPLDKFSEYEIQVTNDERYNSFKPINIEIKDSGVSFTYIYTLNITVTYGIDIDTKNSNPETAITYTDDAVGFTPVRVVNGVVNENSWMNSFLLQGIKPCVYKDKSVNYYLNPNDYTKKANGEASDITSGQDGDVMVEFFKMYQKIWVEDGIIKIRLSNIQLDESYICPAFMSEENPEIESASMYIASYNSFLDPESGTIRSLSGKTPTVYNNITALEGHINNYSELNMHKYSYLLILMMMVTKTRDLQSAIGYGYSDRSGFLSTGSMNDKGMFYGNHVDTNDGCKMFHIENLWGHMCNFIIGTNSRARELNFKGHAPYPKLTKDRTGYDHQIRITGNTSGGSSGFPSTCSILSSSMIVMNEYRGSNSTYFTDQCSVDKEYSAPLFLTVGYTNQTVNSVQFKKEMMGPFTQLWVEAVGTTRTNRRIAYS